LQQNHPNPFQGNTSIAYSVDQQADVRISILNNMGQTILVPVDKRHTPGDYKFTLPGESLSPGIYYCNMEAGTATRTIKLICQ
jgi:hypothetical protein